MAEALALEGKIFEPDLFIVVNAPAEWLIDMVKKRGRDLERAIDPDYLRCLSETVSMWTQENMGTRNIIEIDSSLHNFAEEGHGRDKVVGKIETKIVAMSRDRTQGKDGRTLTYPDFVPVRVADSKKDKWKE
jgi:deoxyadenosine/deoxycytidine kinase